MILTRTRDVFVFVCLVVFAFSADAQSGRRKVLKNPPQPPPKQQPGPIAEPGRSTSSVKEKTSNKNPDDDFDSGDVVHITSNLVPIPASIFDERGVAVTGLKLDDFELSIDGQVRSLSDLTRTETTVRMAMLFDNSGSLDFAREFEKQAAIHFFRRVMRPVDEAAIYSIETESYLAQPLTHDVVRLEQTIQNFGKPEGSTSLFDAIIDASGYLRRRRGDDGDDRRRGRSHLRRVRAA